MKNKFFFWLKTYLGFSKRESQGFVLVLPILVGLYSIPKIYEHIVQQHTSTDYNSYQNIIDSLVIAGYERTIPNLETQQQDSTQKRNSTPRPRATALNKLDFNEADSIVLQIVPGIGQTMAGRIVKFRDGLGGMMEKEQLLDVFGMNEEVMERVFQYFDFTPGIYKKVAINQWDASSLANHPYITYGAAKVIVAYRTQHGPYSEAEDLLKVKIFTEDWVEKIKPYLNFD
ncbi:ComEA family DNA-binding protein [Mongoliitalea daihaiensis]|uniref:ComEA family DNA-binding protein n=1 Tax=Mongoliitalea daihaiensis TaxID=2782006 RepID=UPI001F402FB4|nr:helix-hairpin-helix domain-containing protein [Mongoliitalea daihaiensis]UJP63288.1 helix-hairpin-helix domain-containing protein [Mongoliitalea daihaiensis]